MNIRMGDEQIIMTKVRPEALMIETDATGVSKPAVVTSPAVYAVYDPNAPAPAKSNLFGIAALAAAAYFALK